MLRIEETGVKEFIQALCQDTRCAWCGQAGKRNPKGFCRSCDKVRKELENLESEPPEAFKRRLAQEKKKDCILWGNMLLNLLDAPVDGSNLEGWFCLAARHIANEKSMHRGISGTLSEFFTDEQQRALSYLFWEIFSSNASHNRERRALRNISCCRDAEGVEQ